MMSDPINILILALVISIPFSIALIYFVRMGSLDFKTVFGELSTILDGELIHNKWGYPQIRVERQGLPITVTYMSGGKYGSAKLRLDVLIKPYFKLQISRENFDTRISKKLRMLKEIKISVEDFDNKFLIKTDDENQCRNFLSAAATREAINRLDKLDGSIALNKDGLVVLKELRSQQPLTSLKETLKRLLPYTLIIPTEVASMIDDAATITRTLR